MIYLNYLLKSDCLITKYYNINVYLCTRIKQTDHQTLVIDLEKWEISRYISRKKNYVRKILIIKKI